MHHCRRIAGVIGKCGFAGMAEVALLVPLSISSRRGLLPSGKGVLGPSILWRFLTAERYVLIVCHFNPFNAKYSENSRSCCSEAGSGEVLSVGRKLGSAFGLICMSGMLILRCRPKIVVNCFVQSADSPSGGGSAKKSWRSSGGMMADSAGASGTCARKEESWLRERVSARPLSLPAMWAAEMQKP